MFTAMVHRPLVWLLAILALLGAGWAAYGPLRQALQPATGTAERAPEARPAGAGPSVGPPAPAPTGDDAKAVAEAPAPPPAAVAPDTRTTVPAEPRPRLAEPPSTAPSEAPTVAAAPAEARRTPAPPVEAAAGAGGQAAAPPPAVEATAEPGLPSAVAPEAEPSTTEAEPSATEAEPSATEAAAPQLSELAPAAGPAPPTAPPAPPLAPPQPTPEGQVAAVSPAPAAVPPTSPAPAVVEPSGAPPAPATSEARQPPPTAPAVALRTAPQTAPQTAKATPLPSTAPASPETSAGAAEPAPARSLSLDTIRRALAALLGGAPEPTDLAGREVEKPEPKPEAVKPDPARALATAAEPSAGPPKAVRPSFDIVRVEPGGRAVVAGRAAPGAEVELLAGERVLDRVRADRRGEWVATPAEPLTPGGLELSLRATSDGAPAVEAEQVVVVVVPEPPPPQPPPVAIAEGPPPQPPPVAGAESPPPQPAEVRLAEAATGPLAVLLAGDGRAPGRILQAPGRISSDGQLALLVLDYDDSGHTRLTGEAPPGAPLRIYVDNEPAAEAVAEPSGRWSAVLGHDLAPGDYTLRLDQLGSQGRPVARLETPFTRVSQPPIQGKTQVDYVIVQPGNSLWRIARRLFGSGMEYVQIYDANQAQIRDPDLIYPGQVFEIPADLGSAG